MKGDQKESRIDLWSLASEVGGLQNLILLPIAKPNLAIHKFAAPYFCDVYLCQQTIYKTYINYSYTFKPIIYEFAENGKKRTENRILKNID